MRARLATAAAVLFFSTLSLRAAGSSDSRLADAVMHDDKQAARALLQQKADVHGAQPDGMTALHWAAQHEDFDTVQLLLKAGAKGDVPTRYGITPMYFAAFTGNAKIIDAMLAAGVSPDSANPGGETALMTAARTGNIDAVRLLLDRGAAVDAKESVRGQTALMWAVLENHPDVVVLLLSKGADINASTSVSVPDGMDASITRPDGSRAMSANIGAAGPGVYRARAIPSPSGAMTPLLFAAREGNLEMVRLLLDSKAEIDRPSANGTTPLVVAIVNNHILLAQFLLERGADPNLSDGYYKRPALFAAIEMRNLDFPPEAPPPYPDAGSPLELIRMLLERGANPNAQTNTTPVRGFMQLTGSWVNFDGQTPFIRAALAGDVAVMKLLLQHGADPNIKTYEGTTALMAAAGVNWVIGQTYSRSSEEYLEAAKLCLQLGGNVNAVNNQGFTAMHGAANRGFDAMVRFLAENGGRVDVKDTQGRTPLTFAEGVFLALQPPSRKPSTIALLQELSNAAKAP